jgi:hypothetical protein
MPRFDKEEEKAKRAADAEAEDILQNKIDRKTSAAPSLDQVVVAAFKYGGIFKMKDLEVHYRITIPDLGRVIHCHTEHGGTVLTKAHMKPKIRETGTEATVIREAATRGKLTRHDADQGLARVDTTYVEYRLNEAVRQKLIHGNYAQALIDGALELGDYELNFYSQNRAGDPWGAKPDKPKHRQIIQKVINSSAEILFRLPG